MIPAHTALYSALSPAQAALLTSRLISHGLVSADTVQRTVGQYLDKVDGPIVAQWCAGLSHAQVVLTLSRETEPLALDTMEALLQRPMYMCARGETAEPLTDVEGRPLPLPLGRRRGEPMCSPEKGFIRRRMKDVRSRLPRDPRIVQAVVPNPKRPGSASFSRFEVWQVGMSVTEARAAGLSTADVSWDVSRGFVSLVLPQDFCPPPRLLPDMEVS